MFRATKEFKRDMAHRLPNHGGKCFNVHGHTYRALITIQSNELQKEGVEEGMIKDFSNFKPIKDWIDENWDHAYVGRSDDKVIQLLGKEGFRTYSMLDTPTAENMSKFLFEKVEDLFPDVVVEEVIVYETPTSFAKYSRT